MSQKAAEVDALNDRLTEEKKRSRDLQWAMEKERCETGRNEESKREELEVCFFPRVFLKSREDVSICKTPKEFREMISATFIHN